jgi:hypothetical protein
MTETTGWTREEEILRGFVGGMPTDMRLPFIRQFLSRMRDRPDEAARLYPNCAAQFERLSNAAGHASVQADATAARALLLFPKLLRLAQMVAASNDMRVGVDLVACGDLAREAVAEAATIFPPATP